jgi:nitrate reductase delta subunit
VDARHKTGMTVQVGMVGFKRKTPNDGEALDRVRDWTRARFALTDDETVMVSEVACSVPGCPPIETHLVFWTGAGRHHFKIFKPLADVVEDDLPPAFMKNALIALEGVDCDCC